MPSSLYISCISICIVRSASLVSRSAVKPSHVRPSYTLGLFVFVIVVVTLAALVGWQGYYEASRGVQLSPQCSACVCPSGYESYSTLDCYVKDGSCSGTCSCKRSSPTPDFPDILVSPPAFRSGSCAGAAQCTDASGCSGACRSDAPAGSYDCCTGGFCGCCFASGEVGAES